MAYIGSTPTSQNFISGTDYFNGTGSQTTFTLTRSVNSVNDIEVVVNNVIQQPNSYTVSGTTLTLSAAPSSGTNNVYARYLSTTTQVIAPSQDTVTTTTIANSAVTPAKLSQPFTSGTAITASGTSIDFTSIPSWVKRITVMVSGLSTNGTSNWLIQLGDAGGIEATGYVGTASVSGNTVAGSAANYSTGFLFNASSAAFTAQGTFVLTLLGSNIWTGFGLLGRSDTTNTIQSAGTKTLSDTLTTVRITTVNGTDTFDAGTINILYE